MKKVSALIILIVLSATAGAQTYYPMLDSVSNAWHHIGNVIPVRNSNAAVNCNYPSGNWFLGYKGVTTGDTVISGTTYLKYVEQAYPTSWVNECLFGYLREDTLTRQIYFRDNQLAPEILLYDFSLQVGDSIYYDFLPFGSYYSDGYFKVDSIVNINIAAGTRRAFFLRNYAAPQMQYPMMWIEGVGHPGHLVFTHAENTSYGGGWFLGCIDIYPRDYYQTLTCFEQSSQKIYFDTCAYQQAQMIGCFFFEDSCTYYNLYCGSLHEISAISQLNISPNPAQDDFSLSIESARAIRTELHIYDLTGHLVQTQKMTLYPGTNEHQVDCHHLRAGVYFIELDSARGKLVKM